EANTTRVDDLIQRGRSQGHLSLAELRTAFDQAGLTPAEGRTIAHEQGEAAVRGANERANELAEDPKPPKARASRSTAAAARGAKSTARSADSAARPADRRGSDPAEAGVG